MHQMGNSDARLFLSPLYEPRHHSLDPLLTREIELTGAYMRTLLEERNMAGVIHYANWNHWRMSAIHTCALWHNVTTILFEAASARYATPIYQEADDLSGSVSGGLGKMGNSQSINYPNPWPGGWWRLSDIVDYSYWSAFGFLEAGASSEKIMKGHPEGKVPSPYFGGIGKKGLTELQQFVNEGGTLITLNESCQLIIDNFNIPVQDIKSDYPTTEYYCPSGIFKVELDPAHPIAYGMEENTNVVLYNSPLLDLIPVDKIKLGREGSSYDHTYVIAKYPVSNPLMSGLLIGDHLMHGKPALIEVEYGKGKIILFGFRPQHRAQPHGTFMLFFNSIYYGAATADTQ